MSASERPSEAALWRAGWRLVAGYVPYVLRGRRRRLAIVVGFAVALFVAAASVGFDVLLSGGLNAVSVGWAAVAAGGAALAAVSLTISSASMLESELQPLPRTTSPVDRARSRALRRNPFTAPQSDDATLMRVTDSLRAHRATLSAGVAGNGVFIGLWIVLVTTNVSASGEISVVGWVLAATVLVFAGVQVFSIRMLGRTDWRLSIIEPVARQRFGHPSPVTNG